MQLFRHHGGKTAPSPVPFAFVVDLSAAVAVASEAIAAAGAFAAAVVVSFVAVSDPAVVAWIRRIPSPIYQISMTCLSPVSLMSLILFLLRKRIRS